MDEEKITYLSERLNQLGEMISWKCKCPQKIFNTNLIMRKKAYEYGVFKVGKEGEIG